MLSGCGVDVLSSLNWLACPGPRRAHTLRWNGFELEADIVAEGVVRTNGGGGDLSA